MKNTLVPFDLEKAKSGEPICFRNGSNAKFIAYAPEANYEQRVIVLDTDGDILLACSNGSFKAGQRESDLDLFMAPKPVVMFTAVYVDGMSTPYSSIERVKNNAGAFPAGPLSICKLTILNGRVVSAETVHEY